MDTSDGLADAAIQIAVTSGVDIVIDASLISSHPELEAYEIESGLSAVELQLYGGEDYGLFCCIEADSIPKDALVTVIGEVQAKSKASGQAYLKINGQRELLDTSKRFQHFSGAAT